MPLSIFREKKNNTLIGRTNGKLGKLHKFATLTQINNEEVVINNNLSLNNQIIEDKDVQLETTRIRNRKQNK